MHWIYDLVFGQLRDEGQYQFSHALVFFDHDFEQVGDGRLGHFWRYGLFFPLFNGLVGGLLGQQVGHHGVDFGENLFARGSFFAILQILRIVVTVVGLLMSFIFDSILRFYIEKEKKNFNFTKKQKEFQFHKKKEFQFHEKIKEFQFLHLKG